ncbi:MAG: fumarylacetoacetate hydrolase family protein, partial [Leadbetterella sp.]|nr:fumarylacetoacetate hydrolase family protein [Leadbetterella sp.]
MKLVTYRSNPESEARLGIIKNDPSNGDLIIDMQKLGQVCQIALPSTMLEFIDLGTVAVEVVENILKDLDRKLLLGTSLPISNAKILAPIPVPRKNLICIGLNYTEHLEESSRAHKKPVELPTKCILFTKPPTCVIGNGDAIEHNENITKQLDWEGELGVIIGKKGKNVPKEIALQYVFGYTIINDISARDCHRNAQWTVNKGQDTFAPMGPIVVTANELTDPHNLNLRTTVNGIEKQNSNTKYMLFNINAQIADISEVMTLEAGDI